MPKKPKTTRRRLPVLTWKEGEPMPTGSKQFYTTDGSFRLLKSDTYEGIAMPCRYVLFIAQADGWRKIAEERSRVTAEKIARERALAWEEEE